MELFKGITGKGIANSVKLFVKKVLKFSNLGYEFFFFVFCPFRGVLAAYGGSQARGLI